MRLDGKVAVVTGGNSGIGLAIVLALARAGASVVIDYVTHPEATEALEREVAALGEKSLGVDADVSRPAEIDRLIQAAVARFGRIDVMVNNAGVETRTSVLDTTEEQYDRVLAINLKSAFFGTQLAAKQMIRQGGGGRIVNVSSVHEDWPMPGNTPYCLSKGGMRMLTRSAGVELAPHGVARRGDPARAHGEAGGDRERRRVPRERRRALHHRDHDLRRRRHHAVEPGPLSDA
jgi:glucose 1-dehydrogenase